MIRINLLPADLRRGTRLPAKVLAVAFASALAVSASIGWFGLKWFGELKDAEQRLVVKSGELVERQRKVLYVDQLEANKADYTSRVQTIQDIGKSRLVWSKFLDELIDATVQLKCAVQGDEQDRLANFHDDIAASPFGKGVTISDPNWTLDEDEGRVPPTSLRFDLNLQFPPTVAKPQAGAPAKAPAKK